MGVANMLGYFVPTIILGTFWRFPIPMGYPIASLVGSAPTILFAVIHDIFGLRVALSVNVRRKLIAPILLSSTFIAFLFVFAVYRAVFDQLPPSQQTYFAPLWPLIKITFKVVAVKVVEHANNPDMAPLVLFVFDALAGLSGNFLFLSASEPESVLSMIFVDVIENMSMAIRVIFLINAYQKAEEERERAQEKQERAQEMEAIASTIKNLTQRIAVFETREAAQVAGVTDQDSNGAAVDGAGETVPLVDEAAAGSGDNIVAASQGRPIDPVVRGV